MFISDCLSVNENGHLTIGGCDAVELAERFATPLYVMDENKIRENCRRFTGSIEKYYGGAGAVAFASKAFLCLEMCKLADGEGLWLDVVSAGEIYTAVKAGFPVERLLFHGNNKTPEDLTYAVQTGVGRIVVDHVFELELLEEIAKSANTRVKVQFRLKPGVEAHTHEFIKTGGIDSKFGFAIETGEALDILRVASKKKLIDIKGVHCHIGSQIFDIEPFAHTASVMLDFMAEAKKELGYELEELNLGGGFGIRYISGHDPVPLESYMEAVSGEVKSACARFGMKTPFIFIEPGRSIVGPAGITLYRVGAVKEIPAIRTYVTVDGGLTDNPRPALYDAEYEMLIANKAGLPRDKIYTVSGRCCETDLLGLNQHMQETQVGDVLASLATGAYNYSMACNYNRLPKPAVVFVKDGGARVVVRRESLDDILKNDL